jgi:ATP-dependent HslUV protease, peptidase subunit HslV
VGMTIISVVKKDNLIAIASDTITLLGDTIQNDNDVDNGSKIIEVAESYIAYCGHASVGVCLEHYFDNATDADLSSRKSIFKESLRIYSFFKEELYLSFSDENSDFEEFGFDLLIANPNGIFGLHSERSISEYRKFYALGTGYKFALGSMHENYPTNLNAKEIAQRSITTAIHFDNGCSGQADIKVISV